MRQWINTQFSQCTILLLTLSFSLYKFPFGQLTFRLRVLALWPFGWILAFSHLYFFPFRLIDYSNWSHLQFREVEITIFSFFWLAFWITSKQLFWITFPMYSPDLLHMSPFSSSSPSSSGYESIVSTIVANWNYCNFRRVGCEPT